MINFKFIKISSTGQNNLRTNKQQKLHNNNIYNKIKEHEIHQEHAYMQKWHNKTPLVVASVKQYIFLLIHKTDYNHMTGLHPSKTLPN